MVILAISISCMLGLFLWIRAEIKKAPFVSKKIWRYDKQKKCIEIINDEEIIHIPCQSFEAAVDFMRYSDATYLKSINK